MPYASHNAELNIAIDMLDRGNGLNPALPCPFCGNSKVQASLYGSGLAGAYVYAAVHCTECGAESDHCGVSVATERYIAYATAVEFALAKWNLRSPNALPPHAQLIATGFDFLLAVSKWYGATHPYYAEVHEVLRRMLAERT